MNVIRAKIQEFSPRKEAQFFFAKALNSTDGIDKVTKVIVTFVDLAFFFTGTNPQINELRNRLKNFRDFVNSLNSCNRLKDWVCPKGKAPFWKTATTLNIVAKAVLTK